MKRSSHDDDLCGLSRLGERIVVVLGNEDGSQSTYLVDRAALAADVYSKFMSHNGGGPMDDGWSQDVDEVLYDEHGLKSYVQELEREGLLCLSVPSFHICSVFVAIGWE